MLEYLEEDLELIYRHTKECWDDLRNQTIFITGGTGFFGVWLVMSLVHANKKLGLNIAIILLTRNKKRFLEKHPWLSEYQEIEYLEDDILNFRFIENKVDYIIHAATEASVKLNLEEPLTMFETTVNGTKRILEFARQKQVKSFLLTSSGAVYGKQPSVIENISEEYIGAPVTSEPSAVYGEGKRMSEVLCSVYYKHFKVPVKIARCYAFIGPFLPLDSHFAAGNFIKNLIEGEDIVIEGDGTPFRSYMYAADLVVWLLTTLFKGTNNRPYNIGSEQSITIAQLANLIANENTEVIIKSPASDSPALRYVPSTKRAKEELNLEVYTSLETALKKTIEFNKRV